MEGMIHLSARKMSLLALFIALSVIGASIKIPAVIGSVALDVFPALFASVLIGKRTGAVVAGLGHILTALLGGMPLGPLHVVVAAEMAVIVWFFGLFYQTGKKGVAGLFFIITNGFIAPLPMLLFFGVGFYVAVLPSLFIGAIINGGVALVIIPRFDGVFRKVFAEFN